MRILHVNKFLYRRGGAEAYMLDLAALQRARGDEVAFFGMQHPDNDPQPYAASFPSRVEFEPPPASFTGKARAAARMFWSSSAARGIDTVLADFDPDVVHLHNIYHHLSPSILRPIAARRIPAVMTLHDYKLACPTYQFLDKGELCQACLGGHFSQAPRRRCKGGSLGASALAAAELSLHTRLQAYASIGRFVCPSQFMADTMASAGVFPDRLRHVPHFADIAGVVPGDAPGRGIAVACRLSHEKGIDVVIDAVGRLRMDTTLDIAGEGPERGALEERAAAVAPGRVTFHGRLPGADVQRLLRGAVLVCVPSRWYENQPMIVLEALACGTPVVASDLGGAGELVTPGGEGALVPANDPSALAAAMAPLLTDPSGARAMGLSGRAKVQVAFAPDRHLANLDAVYGEATDMVGRTKVGS
ncbi:MAG: glycosyltransferase family 4 protein [Actinobacteria bacterium]|nr:glycosyltransferase family 4 protein [Actinomycetota bacterium]